MRRALRNKPKGWGAYRWSAKYKRYIHEREKYKKRNRIESKRTTAEE